MGRVTTSDPSPAEVQSTEQGTGRGGPSWAGPAKLPGGVSLAVLCCAHGS